MPAAADVGEAASRVQIPQDQGSSGSSPPRQIAIARTRDAAGVYRLRQRRPGAGVLIPRPRRYRSLVRGRRQGADRMSAAHNRQNRPTSPLAAAAVRERAPGGSSPVISSWPSRISRGSRRARRSVHSGALRPARSSVGRLFVASRAAAIAALLCCAPIITRTNVTDAAPRRSACGQRLSFQLSTEGGVRFRLETGGTSTTSCRSSRRLAWCRRRRITAHRRKANHARQWRASGAQDSPSMLRAVRLHTPLHRVERAATPGPGPVESSIRAGSRVVPS